MNLAVRRKDNLAVMTIIWEDIEANNVLHGDHIVVLEDFLLEMRRSAP